MVIAAAMRPASEIHSALDLCTAELDRMDRLCAEMAAALNASDDPAVTDKGKSIARAFDNLLIARNVLAWVAGDAVDLGGDTAWLCAFLLDDPPKLQDFDSRMN